MAEITVMILHIDGQRRAFTSLRDFRARHQLPETFSTAYFQPKTLEGLGSIEGAGAALRSVREAVIAAVPSSIPASHLLTAVDAVCAHFRDHLTAANDRIGLKPAEIEYAAAGMNAVCQAYGYALLRAHLGGDPTPAFESVYQTWLDESVRIASPVYPYPVGEACESVWGVQVVANAYGRVGLIVAMETETAYVYDPALACPAEGFMVGLLRDVCAAFTITG
ncbi:MAG: hypothetical protein SF162_13635 [bacterium]|nr:hypothetical protein [bacterium]